MCDRMRLSYRFITKLLLIPLLIISFLQIYYLTPVFAECSPECGEGYVCEVDSDGNESCIAEDSSPPTICEFTSVVVSVFNMVVAVFPFLGLAILMFGAFLWATAGADPQKVQLAQQTLTYGVIGFIAGLSAVAIVGTLEMLLIGDDRFKWIGDDGVLRVDFCIEDYEDTGNTHQTVEDENLPHDH